MKKLVTMTLALTLVAGLLTGCGGKKEVAKEEVIKIGVFEPLTGENGGGGSQEVDGIKYANQVYPEVLGKKVELVIVDNKSDKGEASIAASRLVEKEKVAAVIGSYGSGVSIAAGDIFKTAKTPAMGASCTNPMVTEGNEYYFRTCFLDPFQGTVMAQYAIKQGKTKAAIITQIGDDYSTGLGNFFEKAFVKLGGEIVSKGQFQTNEQDFNSILTNVKAAGAEVIFAPSSITTAGLIIKQTRALGIDAIIMGADTWENEAILDVAGESAEGVVLSTFFDENNTLATEEGKKFVKGFKEYLGGENPVIPAVASLGYDAYLVIIKAIEAAGSTDGDAIKDALVKMSGVEGVTGVYSFDENGDAIKDVAVIKTVVDGKFKYVDTVIVK